MTGMGWERWQQWSGQAETFHVVAAVSHLQGGPCSWAPYKLGGRAPAKAHLLGCEAILLQRHTTSSVHKRGGAAQLGNPSSLWGTGPVIAYTGGWLQSCLGFQMLLSHCINLSSFIVLRGFLWSLGFVLVSQEMLLIVITEKWVLSCKTAKYDVVLLGAPCRNQSMSLNGRCNVWQKDLGWMARVGSQMIFFPHQILPAAFPDTVMMLFTFCSQ